MVKQLKTSGMADSISIIATKKTKNKKKTINLLKISRSSSARSTSGHLNMM
jgi:hypothetical protein